MMVAPPPTFEGAASVWAGPSTWSRTTQSSASFRARFLPTRSAPLAPKGALRHGQVNRQRRCAPITIPICVITMRRSHRSRWPEYLYGQTLLATFERKDGVADPLDGRVSQEATPPECDPLRP